jgi:hypothetical protein
MAGLGAKQQFEELGWSVYREERVGDPRFLVVGSWSDQVCSKEGGWRSVLLDQVGDFAFLELHGFCGSDGGGLYEFWVKSSLVAGDWEQPRALLRNPVIVHVKKMWGWSDRILFVGMVVWCVFQVESKKDLVVVGWVFSVVDVGMAKREAF